MNQDEFFQQLKLLYGRVIALQNRVSTGPQQEAWLPDALAELSTTFEELQVAEEELHAQNEQLDVTRESVEAERQRYQNLFELAPDGYLVTDLAGKIQDANHAATILLNVSQKFLKGKLLIHFVNESERQDFRTKLNQMGQVERVQGWTVCLHPRHSTPLDAELTVSIVREPGQSVTLLWSLRDVTDRKRTEEALLRAKLAEMANQELEREITERKRAEAESSVIEERYRTLFESIDEGFCVCEMLFDPNGKPVDYRFLETNPVFEKLTGLKQAPGKTARELVPNLEEHWFEIYGNVALTGEAVRFVDSSDAMNSWFNVYAFRLGGQESRKFAVLFTDITEGKRAEEALRLSEERMRLATAAAKIYAWEFDQNRQKAIYTENAEQVVGFALPEDYADNIALIHEDDRQYISEKFERAIADQGRFDEEFRFVNPHTGQIVWHSSQGVFISNAENKQRLVGISQNITERKRTEEALQQSEQRLRAIVNQLTAGIAQCDLTGRFTMVNQKFCDIVGYSQEELLQKGILEITHPDYSSLGTELFQCLVTEGADFLIEKRYVRKDGSEIWVNNSLSPVRDASGQVQSAVAVVLDVSEAKRDEVVRKQSEIALQNSEAKFRAVFDQMHQYVGLVALDGMLLEINQAPLTFSQVEREPFIGKPIWELPCWKVTAELQEMVKAGVAQAAAGHFVHFYKEVPISNFEGESYTFDISVKPIYAPNSNQVTWVIVEGRDITSQVSLQNALRQEQARSLQLITSSVDGIIAFDTHGCCTLWNPAMTELTGLPQGSVVGKRGMDVFSSLLDAEALQSFYPVRDKSSADFDFHFTHPTTGQRQWMEARYSPLHDGGDLPHGGLMIVRDVTKQREIEQMQREFISIISHEIRTPLSSIRGALGLVTEGIFDDDPQAAREMLSIASNNIERLVRLVQDVLALNWLESGQVQLKQQWRDAAAMVQQACSNVQDLTANQIVLRSSVSEIQVWVDPDWLVQVLVNLINNAVKFSPAGTTVSVNAQTQPQQVLFQVTDQGRGIPTEKLETIFGRFQQVDASDSRQKGGTGLGLAICHLIVQLHGGRIWAESELGHGSTFCFTLPIPSN